MDSRPFIPNLDIVDLPQVYNLKWYLILIKALTFIFNMLLNLTTIP